MPQPKISVGITTNLNGIEYLSETIPAIMAQDYPNLEIVVTDDSSSDNTSDFLKQYKDVKYYRLSSNQNGYGINKNFCVSKCTGEYILLLDNDILIKDTNYVSNIFEKYLNDDKTAFLGASLFDKGKETTKYFGIYHSIYGINIHRREVPISTLLSIKEPIDAGSYHGGGVFFSRNIWDELGGYDTLQPFMLDDTDLSARAYSKGYKVKIFTDQILSHIGINNHSNNEYFKWKFSYYYSGIATVQLKNFHWSRLYRLIVLSIVSPFIYASVAYKYKNLGILSAYFSSVSLFIKNLPKILKKRRIIQNKRVSSIDYFSSLKSPF